MCLEVFKKFTKRKYNVIDEENKEKLLLETLRDIEKQLRYYYLYKVISNKECIFAIFCIVHETIQKISKNNIQQL